MAADDLTPRSTSLSGGDGGATTLVGLTDTPAGYGVNGQVLTTNGVNAATWATSAGVFALDPSDWKAIAGVEGVGTGTALAAASFPDLSVADAGQALAAAPAELTSGALRLLSVVNDTNPAGIDLGNIANATDGAVAVSLRPYIAGLNYTTGQTYSFGLAIVNGTDSAANNNVYAGIYNATTPNGSGLFHRGSTAGRGTFSASGSTTYDTPKGAVSIDLALTRDGATGDCTWWVGESGGWRQLYRLAAFASGAAKVMLMMHSGAASLTVGMDVTHICKAGVLTQDTPPRAA